MLDLGELWKRFGGASRRGRGSRVTWRVDDSD